MEDSVNVLKFAECRAREIATLMDEVTSKQPKLTLQKLPYHMRRRAASHNPKRLPRSLRIKAEESVIAKKPKKKRKCHKSLLEEYNSRQSADSTWLPTHIWFAKRFHMKKMWGYQLPVQATGKRFRSSYRATIKNALVQDLSYFCCIELRGIREKLLSGLSTLTDDSLGMNFASESYIDGSKEGSCFLYHPHSFPLHAIGPVTFFWKPSSSSRSNIGDSSNQLWIWCHPVIHEELIQVFIDIFQFNEDAKKSGISTYQKQFASNVNYMKTKLHFRQELVYSNSDVTMNILKNTLVRHRLIGPNSLSILTSVLNLADSECNDSTFCLSPNQECLLTNVKQYNENISRNVVNIINENLSSELIQIRQKVWNHLSETKSSYSVPMKTIIGLTVDDPRLYVTPKDSNYSRDGQVKQGCFSVLKELSNPLIACSTLWHQGVRNKITSFQVPEHAINSERAKYVIPNASDLKKCTSKVPVILIHQPQVNGYGSGWDIIAPQGWGMAFWIPLIYHGAQPAGFDDYCSINMESGYPTFPCSFPDTKAGASYEETIRETNLKKFYRYSRAKRPNFKVLGVVAPFFMPWNVLVTDWEKEFCNKYSRDSLKSTNIKSMFVMLNSNSKSGSNFFVLRSRKQIMHLRHLCHSLDENRKNSFGKSMLRKAHNSLVQSLMITQNDYLKCIILVRVKCLFRGTPTNFSGIYLPNATDLQHLIEDPKYFGPVEQQHSLDDEYLSMPAKKRRKLLKEEAKVESKKLDRPEVKNVLSHSDRKQIGYISEGGYCRLGGQGYGIGHCALTGFITGLEMCMNYKLGAIVLVREQHNFQYRPASVEVIEY